ncbi:MAG: recombination regulator RecX [Gammaproteobacteria bacterium]|nr:recombination regulator RecX [Gammaproteobacteria bacterium]
MLKQKTRPDKTAYANALRLLAMREHSEFQLWKKLEQREFDEIEISDAIEQLKSENYLSDLRFAESYLRSRKLKLYGPVKIRLELEDRGVASSIISQVMSPQDEFEESEDWFAIMKKAYGRKYGDSKAEGYFEKTKRCRYLQNRGFESSLITNLIKL